MAAGQIPVGIRRDIAGCRGFAAKLFVLNYFTAGKVIIYVYYSRFGKPDERISGNQA
jgi:hypothetical protein